MKIIIKGVFVNEVIADNDISKYFTKDILDEPEYLFFFIIYSFCLKPMNETNPLIYKFFSSNFFK